MDETAAATGRASVTGSAGSVDEVSRIRDIIFGANMRDYERRFELLEQRLMQELTALRADLSARFAHGDTATSAEFDRVHDRVTSEVLQMQARLQSETDSRHSSIHEMHDAVQQTRDASDVSVTELRTLLEARAHELRDGKTDRHQLGALLRQIGETLQAPSSDVPG